ncbi:MAG: triose-phosphate isomerase [Alistipes sp.]|jgi:triosephosphate isomerase|nr:triose-phosphate isomerase [Alistipes sp.]
MRKKFVAGNWKMNTTPEQGVELVKNILRSIGHSCASANYIVCPPFTHLSEIVKVARGTAIRIGAQNCAEESKGAYTGEVSAEMIAATGASYVILGHSERRQYYGETSDGLNKKMRQTYSNGLVPIYCVGETLEERESGKLWDVVKAQVEEVVFHLSEVEFRHLIVAYEPVWAIGTGKVATAAQAQEMHAFIRKVLTAKFGDLAAKTPILYGGSVKPENAAEIFAMEDVDGGLVGGASLNAADFLAIGDGFRED